MGGALLGLIGGIYRDRARIETSLFEGCSVAFKQSGDDVMSCHIMSWDIMFFVMRYGTLSKICLKDG